MELLKGL